MEEAEKLKREILNSSPKAFSLEIAKAIEYIQPLEQNLQLHLLSTALIVAQAGFDATCIIAALLHDSNPYEDMKEEVMELVKGVRQIEATTKNEDTKDEVITKYILNNAKDLRSVIIKLASVLDKVRNIEDIRTENKKKYLKQATTIYSDIAEYLELGDIKKEIDERVFRELQPIEYQAIENKYKENNIDEKLLNKYLTFLNEKTKGIDVEISGRIKSKYSVYNKLKKYEKEWKSPNIKSLFDLIACRCICDDIDTCYKILEKFMDTGELDTEHFHDYISTPKQNGYEAIHSIIEFKNIAPLEIEVQILTHDMHYTNTYGKASHIAYKASKSRYANPTDKYHWIEEVHNAIQKNIQHREKQINTPVDINLFQEDIFVFTPKGEIIPLSKGDTALDFAYRIHSQVGNSAVAVKINTKAAKLGQILQTGDMVEIKTQKDKKHHDIKMLQNANSQSTKNRILKSILKSQKN